MAQQSILRQSVGALIASPISQYQIAKETGVSQSNLSRLSRMHATDGQLDYLGTMSLDKAELLANYWQRLTGTYWILNTDYRVISSDLIFVQVLEKFKGLALSDTLFVDGPMIRFRKLPGNPLNLIFSESTSPILKRIWISTLAENKISYEVINHD